jgi:hypothetical protein
MGTKWESWSQALLRSMVPEWERMIVDGRKNWSPTGFIPRALESDCDYVLHVDEDCFVSSREGLLDLIDYLDDHPDLAAAGIPDGGHYYRRKNAAALNLFFVVFRAQALRKAWADMASLSGLEYQSRYGQDVLTQRPELDETLIDWTGVEPYYPLYWGLRQNGGNLLYLRNALVEGRWSTRVLAPSGEVVAEHLWYLRRWFSKEVMPGHDRPNQQRYQELRAELWYAFRMSPSFWLSLGQMHLRRSLRRMEGLFLG